MTTAVIAADVRSADACAPAYPPGAAVRIADESAIIVWDQASRIEHFIRRATFASDTPDFGFLVPTPSKPELAEAPDSVFQQLEPALEEWLAPYVAKRWLLTAIKIAGAAGSKAIATSAVCMSFKAERPFYPYREPAEQRETMPASLKAGVAPDVSNDRRLRVFFVSDARMDGAVGEGGRARVAYLVT